MNSRPLTPREQRNAVVLQDATSEIQYIYITATQIAKSIIDATAPMRDFLIRAGLHDYAKQLQGDHHKVSLPTTIVLDGRLIESTTSLYRPPSKTGDPRFWVLKFKPYLRHDDVVALLAYEGRLFVYNLSRGSIADDLASGEETPATGLIQHIRGARLTIAFELLAKLRKIALVGPIAAGVSGDTAIGRLLESLLGIKMNARQAPDYHGIELKSYRDLPRPSLQTLFALAPSWTRSIIRGSRDLLAAYGPYTGSGDLYVTVGAKANAQGLRMGLDDAAEAVFQESLVYPPKGRILYWSLPTLMTKLETKHHETFWIKAKSMRMGGIEHFQFESVLHTRDPVVSQFGPLVEQGAITLDLTISPGRDHGYLWRMHRRDFHLLFPPGIEYDLTA